MQAERATSRGEGSAGPPGAAGGQGAEGGGTEAFECNVCLEPANDPVITMCGHLFCWPCIYQWLEVRRDDPSCPVCKSAINRDKLIPLYGRGKESKDPRAEAPNIPRRPAGQREESRASQAQARAGGGGGGGAWPHFHTHGTTFHVGGGFGMFPGLFGFQWNNAGGGGAGGAPRAPLTAREERELFLSRATLAMGAAFLFLIMFM